MKVIVEIECPLIPKAIADAVCDQRLSYQDVANTAKTTSTTVWRVATEKARGVNFDTLMRIAHTLGLTQKDLGIDFSDLQSAIAKLAKLDS